MILLLACVLVCVALEYQLQRMITDNVLRGGPQCWKQRGYSTYRYEQRLQLFPLQHSSSSNLEGLHPGDRVCCFETLIVVTLGARQASVLLRKWSSGVPCRGLSILIFPRSVSSFQMGTILFSRRLVFLPLVEALRQDWELWKTPN